MNKLGVYVLVINFESIMFSYSMQGGKKLKYTSFENYIYI